MILVDDADMVTVWEPEEAKVLGFMQVLIQVVQDLVGRREEGGERILQDPKTLVVTMLCF